MLLSDQVLAVALLLSSNQPREPSSQTLARFSAIAPLTDFTRVALMSRCGEREPSPAIAASFGSPHVRFESAHHVT